MLRITTLRKFLKPVVTVSTVRQFSGLFQDGATSIDDGLKSKYVKTGLQKFLGKTYMYSGAGVLTTLSVATLVSSSIDLAHSAPVMLTGIGLTIGGLIGMHFGKYVTDEVNNTTTNDPMRLLGYGALVTGMGLTSAPMFAMMDLSYVLPPALLMTNFVFCGATIYAKYATPGTFLRVGPALMGGLMGLVGTSLVGLGSEMIFGPNMFSSLAHNLDLYAGIPLFTGFVAYDTHVAIERYQRGDPDHLGTSVQLYLDFMNILIRMMQIISKHRNDR